MAAPGVSVVVERAGRTARVRVALPRVLEAAAVSRAIAEVGDVLAPLAREPAVGLLLDTRALEEAGEGALEALGELEIAAARVARVTRVARLVASEALADEANRDAEEAGIALAVRAFTQEADALAFVEAA